MVYILTVSIMNRWFLNIKGILGNDDDDDDDDDDNRD